MFQYGSCCRIHCISNVGEGDRFCVVVVLEGTISILSTGAAQGGGWGECTSRARVWVRQE